MGIGGCWMLDVGYWMLDAGYWILDSGYWSLVTEPGTLNSEHRLTIAD
jgi:hypothetical protein